MKLQKYLSQAGVCSRRKAEEHIAAGLVKVNGEVAHIGQVVDSDIDKITVDGRVVKATERLVYYAFNKPRNVVTTNASGEKDLTIADVVRTPERVFPIGRLDKETTGLILLTNDGRLSNYLMHPSHQHEKEYLVEIYGRIEDRELDTMARGMYLKDIDYRTQRTQVKRLASGRFSIILREGKNRQIRRMLQALGHMVKRLKRIRIENIDIGDMEEGDLRALSARERDELLRRVLPKESEKNLQEMSEG